jgi:Tfp pilus assembly protein PilO
MMEQKKSTMKLDFSRLKKSFSSIKIDKKQETQIVLALTIILSVLFIYIITLAIVANFKADKTQYLNIKNQNAYLQEKRGILQDLAKEKETRADYLSRVEYVMPQTDQTPEILLTLSKLASDNNIVIANFTPKTIPNTGTAPGATPTVRPVNYSKVSLSFDVSGSYLDIKEFFKSIESNIRPINVLNINISGGSQISTAADQDVMRFRITAEVYYESIGVNQK